MEVNISFEESIEGCLEEGWLRQLAERVLAAQDVDSRAELSLVIVSQERIRELNLAYLERDRPTDVMAFSMLPAEDKVAFVTPPDGIQHLGEIIISYPQAVIQAKEHRHSIKKEITILIIHGVLHLLGYEHDKPELEKQMKAREMKILDYVEGK